MQDQYRHKDDLNESNGSFIEQAAETTINEVPVRDYIKFIGNNHAHYIHAFKKNENKKRFIHFNWSAALFSTTWMFYRKMYIEGLVFLLVTTILSTMFTFALNFGFSDQFRDLNRIGALEQKITYEYQMENDTTLTRELIKLYKQKNSLNLQISLYTDLFVLLEALICGMIADMLYRNYVRKNIKQKDGGVSIGSAIAAVPLSFVVGFISLVTTNALVAHFIL